MKEYKSRSEVPDKYKFDLMEYFKDIEDWQNCFHKVKKEIPNIEKYKGKLKDAKKLEEFLELYLSLTSQILNLCSYAALNNDVDLENEIYIHMLNSSDELDSQFGLASSFFSPEIIAMKKEEYQNLFLRNKNLEKFHVFLDEIYEEKEHTLSEAEEKIIATLSSTFSSYQNISSSLINSEHDYGSIKLDDGEKIIIAPNNLYSIKKNKNQAIRKKAQEKFGKTLAQYQNTESSLLNYYIKNKINLAQLHHFNDPWEKKLHDIHIPNITFENMKKIAKKERKVWQSYFHLMKEILNLKTLHSYDTALDWEKQNFTYSIENAQDIVINATKVLGQDYTNKIKKVFNNKHIDYCQYKGKISGGYSLYTFDHSSRIVINYKNSYNDVLTIAHEVGHNVHHQYIQENNSTWYCYTSSYIGEVASLTNEFLTNNYIAENGKTIEEKRIGVENNMKTFQNNFFGSIILGELEQTIYEDVKNGKTLTASYLNELNKNIRKEYQGSTIKNDDAASLSWATTSHYYLASFYMYSYALCVSIAAAIANRIQKGEKEIIQKYQKFLKQGSDKYPKEIYQTLGVNIEDEKIFTEAIEYFKSQIEYYNKLKEVK